MKNKRQIKSFATLFCAAMLLTVVPCLTSHATLINQSGTATLADVDGATTPPEALTVSWSVVENPSAIYTYTYTISNPSGDVLIPPNSGSEIVDSFVLHFNSTIPGAVVSFNDATGLGASGLAWFFSPVAAGSSSGALSFQSDDPPTMGDASASDDNPPSPWAGDQLPVPTTVPDSMSTVALLAGMVLLLPICSSLREKAGSPHWN